MKLLLITRKIDSADSRMGFFVDWVVRISKLVDEFHIICWQKSDPKNLPKNIAIYNLPKSKLWKIPAMKLQLLALVPKVDGVFTHMMPIYAIITGFFTRIFRKKLIHWYTHRSVDLKLRISSIFVNEFVTASKESFRLKTKKKVHILGHGIDTEYFKPAGQADIDDHFKIITVGRISPSKDYESMIKAVYDLREKGIRNISLEIIGAPGGQSGEQYQKILEKMLDNLNLRGRIRFVGPIEHKKLLPYFNRADLFINLSSTGSLDKAVLEAMATETIVITSNEAFKPILPEELFVEHNAPKELADKIEWVLDLELGQTLRYTRDLRQTIVRDHNLDSLIKKIIDLYKS